ncbi:MAG: DUF2270 domain-containing protein [Hyphomicrobiales bacterium]|nr:DUF2270 domain-containing protein [Hyphomicrobiales bacterium]MBV8769839.1 DUF2270 domain-containing protein [Hyphomicrobiales bacterium]MBV9051147.1 DUF2270 domain-containing protein [Hyphomicrobiales bacterium]MBV9135540.1 DUF2270 domain-containing protein [Hyphomicrobiales bacterium]MBV9592100.1 DUF2270 domain-containing protein [Hyphomicrobiales bacterium]
MDTKTSWSAPVEQRPELSAPAFPGTPSEFITVLAHYHRAEIARMAGWRDRIDRTTNWAITVVGAMLSVSLSTPTAHHGVVLFAMVLVLLLLVIESRRYRFFDVYRARVRRLERNYYAQVLAPEKDIEKGWTKVLGDDLRRPRFHISLEQAISRRLRRNYCWLFVILLLAWLLKITSAKLQPGAGQEEFGFSLPDWLGNAAIGPLPGWLVVLGVVAFYGWLAYAAFRHYEAEGELAYGNVHV